MTVVTGVSVCIPTHRRPDLLVQCVRSAFRSACRPLEVVVSDDAPGAGAREALAAVVVPRGITLRYVENLSAPGQAGNVMNAFRAATMDHVVLMHDDDLFVEGGIDALVDAWNAQRDEVDAVYGFQYVADSYGAIVSNQTTRNNNSYFRNVTYLGLQSSNLWAALVAQFPNNGFLIRRTLALQAGYPDEGEVGRAPVDYHFGVRYAQLSTQPFLLIPEYVSVYRRSAESVARSPKSVRSMFSRRTRDGHLGWKALREIEPACSLDEDGLRLAKERAAPAAVEGYLAIGERREAVKILRRYARSLKRGPRWWMKIALQFALASMPSFARPRSVDL
ncbi:MAG: glycosyltransferase family 2 protein [Alphaproteobacteria bacterium]